MQQHILEELLSCMPSLTIIHKTNDVDTKMSLFSLLFRRYSILEFQQLQCCLWFRHRCQIQFLENLHVNFFVLLVFLEIFSSFFWLVWQRHPLWHTFLQCSWPRFCTPYLIDSQQVPCLQKQSLEANQNRKLTLNYLDLVKEKS